MKGPASRFAYDPIVLVAYLDSLSEYHEDGHPIRRRHFINGVITTPNLARTIRRWRSGRVEGVTLQTATSVLGYFNLSLHTFELWALAQDRQAVKRGQLKLPTPIPTGEDSHE